jgi:hypothetical protein
MNKILILICVLYGVSGYAQTDHILKKKKQHFMISGTFGSGSVLPSNPFVKGENMLMKPIEKYQYVSLRALWQNPGYTSWQQLYKGPYYGIGLAYGDFQNPQEIGHPISYYGILGIPIKRWKWIEIFSEVQFGMASNWNFYDSLANPKNIVIGGGLTIHLDISLKLNINLSPRIDVGSGLSFIHFSNGGFERPNRGFNIYSPFVELKYRFAKRPDYKNIQSLSAIKKSTDLYLMLGYGDHQLVEHEFDTNYFAIGGLSIIFFRQFSNAFRVGMGTDMNYWMGLTVNKDGTMGPRTTDNITAGLILQPEMIIDRLTLTGGFGIYARHLQYGNFQQTYQRLGVRFNFYKNLSFGVNVRAVNFMLAEFLEFNLGYQIRLGN